MNEICGQGYRMDDEDTAASKIQKIRRHYDRHYYYYYNYYDCNM